jgi:hypothetical protein
MNLTRVAELPLETRGPAEPVPGGVKDWQSDRLAAALVRVEQVFDLAIAEQQKAASVPTQVHVELKSTLSDMQKAGAHNSRAAWELTESAERFLNSFQVQKALPEMIKDGDTSYIAAHVAQAANAEFAKSSFYGVSQDACSQSARLEAMCDRAHALVKAGYIGEKVREGVLGALADPTSAKARAAEAFTGIAKAAGFPSANNALEDMPSQFVDDASKLGPGRSPTTPTIYVDSEQAKEFAGKTDPAAAAKVFSHELGHWLARDKTPEVLAAGIEGVKAAGGKDAAYVSAFFKQEDLTPERLDSYTHEGGGLLMQELLVVPAPGGKLVSASWTYQVGEMQGDLLGLAVENVISGKAAAVESAHALAAVRDAGHVDRLSGETSRLLQGEDPHIVRFGAQHHTSAAVRDFADRIQAGDLDKVHTPQQLDKLMGESIVRGLIQEYTAVRGAELNIHHVENGRAIPGVPPGVDLKAVLAAEMNSGFKHIPGEPTFLLAEKPAPALFKNAPGVALEVGGMDGGAPPQSFWLTTKAPGVAVPEVPAGPHKVGDYNIAGTMLPFAKDIHAASQAKELMATGPSAPASSAELAQLPQLTDAGQSAKPAAAEAKAEASQSAPTMSM